MEPGGASEVTNRRARSVLGGTLYGGPSVEFSSKAEMLAAMVITARWLPELVGRVERGVKALGAEIEKKAMLNYPDGKTDPVLLLRGRRGWHLELHLRNAMEDFLLLDRDEKPIRLDPRLFDSEFAEKKLTEVVEGRLDMVRAFNRSRRAGDVADHIQKLGAKHGRYRIWEFEGEAGGEQ
jgi:hypothetical protein